MSRKRNRWARRLGLTLYACLTAWALTGRALADGGEEDASGVAVPILMYHSILGYYRDNDYCLSARQFEGDLAWLKAHGYETVFVSDLADYVLEGGPLPEKPVVVTLDDGFLNGLTTGLPLLEEYDMKAVVSVVGSYTERAVAEADPNPSYAYLTWEDIRTLSASGRVEIGSHTWDMHSLDGGRKGAGKAPGEAAADYQAALGEDLARLQTLLTERSGVTPTTFAYPYGATCPEALPVLQALGFTAALTCEEHINCLTGDPAQLFSLGRFNRPANLTTEGYMARVGLE
ncbi:MAG: polysaccharide deacetylase family protein [Clostridiales bacterium]|nr:polysaccharide deacetylase family protein [Clostridiales bacterium]